MLDICVDAVCISFVVAKPPKAAPKKAAPKPDPAPAPAPAAEAPAAPAPIGFFFDTRTGRYFVRDQSGPNGDFTRLVECPPPGMPPMAMPRMPTPAAAPVITQPPPPAAAAEPVRRRRKSKPKLLEAAKPEINWTWAKLTAEQLELTSPDGVGYPTPDEAIEAAVDSGLDVGGRQVHVMPGRRGGYFVVGVSDC
ncbi:hypothetical protein TWF696_005170 [Orbilia brochopaga]|uniref:Uncharacterized protein n=1 Tax=Orbilia brochopaga TaxID=3140254 RepID=A0AAV9V1K0_9PEZI